MADRFEHDFSGPSGKSPTRGILAGAGALLSSLLEVPEGESNEGKHASNHAWDAFKEEFGNLGEHMSSLQLDVQKYLEEHPRKKEEVKQFLEWHASNHAWD